MRSIDYSKYLEMISDMIDEKLITHKDIVEAMTILVWMDHGRKAAERISSRAVKNLEKNGFAEKGKLIRSEEFNNAIDIWFLLAVLGAKGIVAQRAETTEIIAK